MAIVIGLPPHACQVIEWGFDGLLLNATVSRALDPLRMARALRRLSELDVALFGAGQSPSNKRLYRAIRKSVALSHPNSAKYKIVFRAFARASGATLEARFAL
jgi:hypothetical protein